MRTAERMSLVVLLTLLACSWPACTQEQGAPRNTAPRAAARPEAPGLRLVLVPLKQHYAPGEPVQALLYIANTARGEQARTVTLDGRMVFHSHLKVTMLDGLGREVEYPDWNLCLDLGMIQRDDFVSIIPGRFYGTSFKDYWHVAAPRAGTYDVLATVECWEDGHEYGLDAWTGKLESNRVKITVGPSEEAVP